MIVWPDNDEPGRAYAHEVARLCGSAATVRMVSLHEILEKYSQSCDSFNTDDWDTHPNQAWPLISKELRRLAATMTLKYPFAIPYWDYAAALLQAHLSRHG